MSLVVASECDLGIKAFILFEIFKGFKSRKAL